MTGLILLAFCGGLLSFFSPCVLPLIPSWLCVTGGMNPGETTGRTRGGLVFLTGIFVAGFSVVFITMSILLSGTALLLSGIQVIVNIFSGSIVILLGLHILFGFLKFLERERRFYPSGKARGPGGVFLAGLAFGAGWTPCAGPVLGSILLFAGQKGRIGEAVLALVFYSLGMGLPFLGAAFVFDRTFSGKLPGFFARCRPCLPLFRRISGALLVVMGLLMLTGRYQAPDGFFTRGGNTLEQPQKLPHDGGADLARALEEAGFPVFSPPARAPEFSLPGTGGEIISLADYAGKVVFLNFWATWCPPCRAEMPAMEALYRRHRSRGFEILAVNAGEDQEKVTAFIRQKGLDFPAALDRDRRVNFSYGIRALPTTYLIDRKGNIVTRITGALDWDGPFLDKVFAALLEEDY